MNGGYARESLKQGSVARKCMTNKRCRSVAQPSRIDSLSDHVLYQGQGVSYVFRIDEIEETDDAPIAIDPRIGWIPSQHPLANRQVRGGASGTWWYCNGTQIYSIPASQAPSESQRYKTYSAFYVGGFGFWILDSDATNSRSEAGWQPLQFYHDDSDRSSYLTNASEHNTLWYQRRDQRWPSMLLPDIYHGHETRHQAYGSLKGELGIFLALVAFSMRKEYMMQYIPQMFFHGFWTPHNLPHGRTSNNSSFARDEKAVH